MSRTVEQRLRIILQLLGHEPEEDISAEHDISSSELERLKNQAISYIKSGILRDDSRNGRDRLPTPDMRPSFDLLVESIPHAVFCKDLEGRFIYGNPAYCALQGISLRELVGKDDFHIHSPEAADKYRADDKKIIQTGEVFRCQEENVHVDGATIWTEVVKAPVRGDSGEITGVMGIFWDVSEQRRAAEALRTSEENLRQLIEHAPLPIAVLDQAGIFLYLNSAFLELFGYLREELRNIDDFTYLTSTAAPRRDELRARIKRDLLEYAPDTTRATSTHILSDRLGRLRHIQVTGSSLHDGNIVLMMTDITHIKEIEDQLRSIQDNLEHTVEKRTRELIEANKRLEDSNKLKSVFLSSVSHELRTPLTSMLGFAKMISKDIAKIRANQADSVSTWEKYATRIAGNAEVVGEEGLRLKRLIDNLLDLGKIESGQMTWRDEATNVNTLVEESVQTMRGHFATKPLVEMLMSTPGEPVMIQADPDRVKQVLVNLLNNAAKFTEQGRVEVSVRKIGNKWAEGRVSDTGPGITQEDIAHLFEDYFQGLQSISTDKGTGLGLSICHQIISHYNGKFWVESAVGQGATFVFRLPLHHGS